MTYVRKLKDSKVSCYDVISCMYCMSCIICLVLHVTCILYLYCRQFANFPDSRDHCFHEARLDLYWPPVHSIWVPFAGRRMGRVSAPPLPCGFEGLFSPARAVEPWISKKQHVTWEKSSYYFSLLTESNQLRYSFGIHLRQ